MKKSKQSIAFVVFSPDRTKVLAVKRSPDDENLPGVWGLPAASLRPGETHRQAVLRAGKEKLGVKLKIVRLINKGASERDAYTLQMQEFEVRVTNGRPTVPQPDRTVSQYTDWKWADPKVLRVAARKGSLCSRLLLSSLSIAW